MEKIFGRHEATPQAIRGVYASRSARTRMRSGPGTHRDLRHPGRSPPPILLAKMARTDTTGVRRSSTTAFADLGFDVDIGPVPDSGRDRQAGRRKRRTRRGRRPGCGSPDARTRTPERSGGAGRPRHRGGRRWRRTTTGPRGTEGRRRSRDLQSGNSHLEAANTLLDALWDCLELTREASPPGRDELVAGVRSGDRQTSRVQSPLPRAPVSSTRPWHPRS